jgi:hypothetical protein
VLIGGDLVEAHTRLGQLLRRSRNPDERRALEKLLLNRRAFADPREAAVGEGQTVRFMGARLLGIHDWAKDGSYLVTLFFTILGVPLYPLGCYVVYAKADGYESYHRIPLTRQLVWWRLAAGGIGVLLLLALVVHTVQQPPREAGLP